MKRKFNYNQIDMLAAALAITERAKNHHNDFAAEIMTWDLNFFDVHRIRILTAIRLVSGDTYRMQKDATEAVTQMMNQAIVALRKLRNRIFLVTETNQEAKQILKSLGFTTFKEAAADQEKMTKLITSIAEFLDIDPQLELTLVGAGVPPAFLQNIRSIAENLPKLNALQETAKGENRVSTEERIIELNEIYRTTCNINRLAKEIFSGEKARYFSFTQIVRIMNKPKSVKPIVSNPTNGNPN